MFILGFGICVLDCIIIWGGRVIWLFDICWRLNDGWDLGVKNGVLKYGGCIGWGGGMFLSVGWGILVGGKNGCWGLKYNGFWGIWLWNCLWKLWRGCGVMLWFGKGKNGIGWFVGKIFFL